MTTTAARALTSNDPASGQTVYQGRAFKARPFFLTYLVTYVRRESVGAAGMTAPRPSNCKRDFKSLWPCAGQQRHLDPVMPGTIHGIIGENGAGKSTLMSILYGFYKATQARFSSPAETTIPDSQAAIRAGIGMVFQHFKLVENFTCWRNVVLGAEDGGLVHVLAQGAKR